MIAARPDRGCCSTLGPARRHTSSVGNGRIARLVGIILVAVALAGALGCDRIREAVDGIRRSNGERWDQGRRRLGR